MEYRRKGAAAATHARWKISLDANGMTLISRWSAADPPEPIVLEFNPKISRATLLGTFNAGRQRSSAGDSASARSGNDANYGDRRR